MRQTVAKNFRDKIIKIYPNCTKNVSYMKFIRYILFSNNWEDKDNYLLKVPQYNLARCEDKLESLIAKNYCGEIFLEEFSNEVIPITWSDWSYSERKCRVVELTLPTEIEDFLLLGTYKDYKKEGGRVYFDTGKVFNRKNRKIALDKALSILDKETEFIKTKTKVRKHVHKIFSYMMNVDIIHFQKTVDKNIGRVRELIKNNNKLETTKVKSYLEILDCIEENLKPMYKGVENSWRLYPANASILGLPRTYRKEICKGWTEFDIKSSQLSIVSVIWNVPNIKTFLKEKNNIWELFFNTFDCEGLNYDDTKKFFKESLYSIIFGKEADKLAKMYDDVFGLSAGQKFLDMWLIKELLQARENEIMRISKMPDGKYFSPAKVGEIKPYFFVGMSKGNQKEFEQTGVMPYSQRKRITSAMAQEVQMLEMMILNPLFDLAEKNTNNFVITLWQHDGFTVKFLNKSHRDKFTNVIVNHFNNNLAKLSVKVPTYLEFEHL